MEIWEKSLKIHCKINAKASRKRPRSVQEPPSSDHEAIRTAQERPEAPWRAPDAPQSHKVFKSKWILSLRVKNIEKQTKFSPRAKIYWKTYAFDENSRAKQGCSYTLKKRNAILFFIRQKSISLIEKAWKYSLHSLRQDF